MTDFGTETMTRGEWWDESAPYGANGYTFGTGEVVNMTGVRVKREITFEMMPGDPNCTARGVAELTDGRVYQFTVRKPGHALERSGRERSRLASLSRESFRDTAYGLLASEEAGKRIGPEDVKRYCREIDAL